MDIKHNKEKLHAGYMKLCGTEQILFLTHKNVTFITRNVP